MFGRSQGLWALRQCQEGVGLSTERWYGGDEVMVVIYRSLDQNLALEWEWGGMGVKTVFKT